MGEPGRWAAALSAASIVSLSACSYGALPPPSPAPPAEADALLREKADYFLRVIHERHLAREGMFLYRIRLSTIDDELAEGSYPALPDTPMYTGMFAAVSCVRAGVETGAAREQALADARTGLDALRFMMDVTGRPGLLPRGVQRAPAPVDAPQSHRWFAGAEGLEEYVWRGDVSMDQYIQGFLPAVADCAPWFPEQTRALVADVARMLTETDMELVDPDGRRTRYGDLSPRAGYSFNTVARLAGYAVFALAAELDGDPRWRAARDELRDRQRVVATSSITNVRVLNISKPSNDLMAWNLYRVLIPLAERTRDPALPDLRRGMLRTWGRVARDQNPYFTLLLCDLSPDHCTRGLIDEARDTLLRFPLEKRKLAPSAELEHLPRVWLVRYKGRPRTRRPIPIELRPASSFEWKSDAFDITGATDPDTEYTGLDYLAAYWAYRRLLLPR